MTSLRIALAQCRQTNDFDANAATILKWLDKAGRAGAQIVCFPETQTVGYRVDIAAPDTPVPFAPSLEKGFIPQVEDVATALRELAAY